MAIDSERGDDMKTVAIANMKEGVGKSTSAMMLADVLSHVYEQKVLLVDCDPQANLSQMILSFSGLKNAKAAGQTITSWVVGTGTGPQVAQPAAARVECTQTITSNISGLDSLRLDNRKRKAGQLSIWASTPELRFAELAFDHLYFEAGDNQSPRRSMSNMLKGALASVNQHYDVVIFDCPPGFSTLAQAAFMQSDLILSPLNVDRVSLWSLMSFWKQGLEEILTLGSTPKHAFLTMVQSGRGAEREKIQVRSDLRDFAEKSVLKTEIPYSVQALRFVRRPTLTSFDTFNRKYGSIRQSVKEFGAEVHSILSSL
tara:strand:+ start:98 stop:1039 length:942 start_codon:yes stop_codon:yes gene_type:complete